MARAKILLFFEYGTLNGGEFSMLAMLEELGQAEFEFVAAAPESSMLAERLRQRDIPILPLELRNEQGGKLSIQKTNSHLLRLIENVSPDLIHSNSLSMGRMVGRVAPRLRAPCTSHLRDIVKLSKAARDDLNRNAALIAVSNATKRFHAEQGVSPEKIQVIYNGVNTNLFRPAPATGILKRQLGLTDNAILCANIGQICLRKGQTVLAAAAARLAREFPELNYLFVGERHSQKPESIAYEKTVSFIFREAGIERRLFLLGFREDIPSILNEVDLLAHTAHQEPLGRVLLEAASAARPIVATNVGGTSEILTDKISALLVPPDDIEALTTAIRRMLKNPELQSRLGDQARKTAVEKFSLPDAAANLRAFWKSFL